MNYMIVKAQWSPYDPATEDFAKGNYSVSRVAGGANGDYFIERASGLVLERTPDGWNTVPVDQLTPGCYFRENGMLATYCPPPGITQAFFFMALPNA